ncbi:MAG: hypothetical protein IJW82_02930, partial [Clostridia bacterium]|nr:hypothetical protein [Clostridia bacterium]
ISFVTSFFTNSTNLYVNKDKTIFKTKSGNKIYDINKTNLTLSSFDTTKDNLEIINLDNMESYVITPSAIRLSTSNQITLYVKRTYGIEKYIYEKMHWNKAENDIESMEFLRDELVNKVGDKFVNESGSYLSKNKMSIKEFTGSLCYDYPIIPHGSYSMKNFATGYTYNVDNEIIRVNMGDNYIVYRMEDDVIYEYTNNNYNNHVVKRVSQITDWDIIMREFTLDFKLSYGNVNFSGYVILGEKSEYELYNINETTVIAAQETAQEVEDIKTYLYGKNYTLKDKSKNIAYTVSGTVLEIFKMDTQEKQYYSFENNAVYKYTLEESVWTKTLTQYEGLYEAIDFDALFNAVNNDKILKILNQSSNYDFESENFYVLNYDKQIDIELPTV